MKKFIRLFFGFSFLIIFSFFSFLNTAQSANSSINEQEESFQRDCSASKEEINLDDLLGPEDNFPFLPDNHRDGSNPIARIGRIGDIP